MIGIYVHTYKKRFRTRIQPSSRVNVGVCRFDTRECIERMQHLWSRVQIAVSSHIRLHTLAYTRIHVCIKYTFPRLEWNMPPTEGCNLLWGIFATPYGTLTCNPLTDRDVTDFLF